MSALDRLEIALARVVVPAHERVRGGKVEHVDTYYYEIGSRVQTKFGPGVIETAQAGRYDVRLDSGGSINMHEGHFVKPKQAKVKASPYQGGDPQPGQAVHIATELHYFGKGVVESTDQTEKIATVKVGGKLGKVRFDQLYPSALLAKAQIKPPDPGGLGALGGNAYAKKLKGKG